MIAPGTKVRTRHGTHYAGVVAEPLATPVTRRHPGCPSCSCGTEPSLLALLVQVEVMEPVLDFDRLAHMDVARGPGGGPIMFFGEHELEVV